MIGKLLLLVMKKMEQTLMKFFSGMKINVLRSRLTLSRTWWSFPIQVEPPDILRG